MGCVPPLQEAFIGEALRSEGYVVLFRSNSELQLSGKHRLIFRRV